MKCYIACAVFFAALCLAYGSVVPVENECTGENEIYMSCGTACPTTCLNRMLIRPCILMCKQGCFCKEGFVRIGVDGAGGNGRCIEESKCDETIRDMTRHD
ncbi:hypothetical protein RDWZM_006243 [Blomia tropicalis]|uniref:TIL domain-containing protein n=1 Tax=Blomia tropicalis TaxID=40697 RepID=A0A9Q0RN67_BLOTA|nr:hypothetical protein BLOT_008989 [Blomia tropicalis]KAJ6220431.1 hypothetical protein RDWZM_006243 [Blomia tropicalis]